MPHSGGVSQAAFNISAIYLGQGNELCFCLASTFSLFSDCIINSISMKGSLGIRCSHFGIVP